jgi:hypothetical protein
VGSGPRVAVGRDEDPVALAPYAVLAAFVPLAFLLWLRNLWTLVRLPGRPVGEAKPV